MRQVGDGAVGLLGVLGGMGPLATADFLAKLVHETPALCDQDHIPCLIMNDPRIPDRSDAILNRVGARSPLPAMLGLIQRLTDAGVSAIAIPCNTAHFWEPGLRVHSPVPVISLVDAVLHDTAAAVAALARVGRSPVAVGLLGTVGTIHAGMFQRRLTERGMTALTPDDGEMADWVMPGIRAVKRGDVDRGKTLLMQAAARLVARGAAILVLACTEIPVVIKAGDWPEATVVDSTAALARACVRYFRAVDTAERRSRAAAG
ncbi:MAG: amino acid racemase [Azospirillaceae bacterium]|nr:amino acid racemase [Azospirillaceae bacterium]